MLFFMGAASHYPLFTEATPGGITGWLVVTLIVVFIVEANALIGTQGAAKKPLDSIAGTIHSGLALWILLVVIIKVTLG
jgi:hypothetical protein